MRVGSARQSVGEKDHVEFRALGGLRNALHQCEILAACLRVRMTPAGNVMSRALDKEPETHLSARRRAVGIASGRGHTWICAKTLKRVTRSAALCIDSMCAGTKAARSL